MNFPHMSDTDFPNVEGVNAYKYQNSFDYSKYDKTQMTIGVCSVPWDVGLIHVGNAQIGGLGNVVYFESKADRDAYIDSREGFRWDSKYRAYHSDGYIEVPLPYDKCVLYNYIYCEYTLLPVEYAEVGKDRFFFFIRECEYLSPNATKVRILRDTWQTFIYDVDISYMMLERGHAPMGLVSAGRYLANPVDNTKYLLADDVNYGEATVNRYSASQILNNGDMWAVVVTSVDYSDNPGDKRDDTWHVPEHGTVYSDGQPSSFAFAIEPSSLSRFLDLVNSNAPQLTQCIKAVFFVEKALVETIESFRFLGFTLQRLAGKESDLSVIELAKAQFGYGERYADIAKLYTMPYAHLEITDESGNVSIVKIEDTQGNLSLQLTTSVAYPWLSLDGHLSGIGKSSGSVVFKNITSHSFNFEGSWYDHLHRWKIPTFAVQQAAQDNYDFATHFDRQQRNAEIETTYNNAVRSADAAKANADASDNAAYANAVRSADAAKTSADASDNTAYGNAVRSANATKANADASDNTAYTNAVRSADAAKASADARDNTAYGNAVRSADATKANADANDLATRTVAENNAQTAYDNAVRLNETSANNILDANAASQQDRINASRTAKENTEKLNKATTDNQADAVGTALIHNTNARAFASEKITIQETKMDGDTQWDYAITAVQAALTAKLNLATMVTNSLQQGMGAAVSGAQMGAIAGAALGPVGMAGGALASAGAGLLGTAANTAFAAANYALVVTNDQEQLKWNNGYMLAKNRLAKNYNFDMTNKDLDFQETQMRNNNSLSMSTTNRSVNASNETARASHNAEVENANRDKSTGDNNAIRSKETANENALADYNNTMANSDELYNTGTSNNARANTAAKTNANQTLTTELANNSRANTTAKANANQSRVTGLDNNARANTAAKTNAEQTRITELANNARSNTTAKANASASRQTALDGIKRDIKQAALQAPLEFGEYSDGDTAATRPIGIFCNIVTQSQDAIEQAGDYFLRFGYAVNRSWDFETFNIMPKFTYWKASDMWISGNNVPDAYLDEIRFYLLGGVCVWRDPNDIGRISIYQNV